MMNGLQTLKEWQKFFNTPSAPNPETINAMYPVGKVFGVFASAFLGDRYGRKASWVVGLFFLLVGTAIQGAAQNPAM
jgi:MFS family permease